MPYCVLESMFSRCPVVATDVGGVAEMLGGTGLIVPPRDPQAMADAMILLLSPGGRERAAVLADRALDRARAHYTIEKCSNRFRDIYGELSDASEIAVLSAAG
jgi:glycosyltransferase involved in cell wall biosynthesis